MGWNTHANILQGGQWIQWYHDDFFCCDRKKINIWAINSLKKKLQINSNGAKILLYQKVWKHQTKQAYNVITMVSLAHPIYLTQILGLNEM